MGVIDDILQRVNLRYEDLTSVERDQLTLWMEDLSKNELSIPKIRQYIASMRDSIENDLTKHDNVHKHDVFLKARLRNYMLLEAFLTSPDKARMALERALRNVKGGK